MGAKLPVPGVASPVTSAIPKITSGRKINNRPIPTQNPFALLLGSSMLTFTDFDLLGVYSFESRWFFAERPRPRPVGTPRATKVWPMRLPRLKEDEDEDEDDDDKPPPPSPKRRRRRGRTP
ncbi:hypothetical protein NFJ02_38g96730 [Pycnococcus provasolii]